MNGLEYEFERFRAICFEGASEEEVANIKRMFLAGALAQADRILSFLDSDLPQNRKLAMLRRVDRECHRFYQEANKAAKERP